MIYFRVGFWGLQTSFGPTGEKNNYETGRPETWFQFSQERLYFIQICQVTPMNLEMS